MQKRQPILFHIILAGVALCGGILILVSTHQGLGIGGDATIYLTTARNLIAGNGMGLVGPKGEFRLIPYAPPFFPIVLSLFGSLRMDIIQADRGLNILLFFIFVLWLGESILWLTRSRYAALFAALLFTFSPVMFPTYSWLMTEPLLMFLGFGGLILLVIYIIRPSNRWLYYASAVGVGFAFLTHYKAVPFLITAGLGIFVFTVGSYWDRIKETVIYCLLGSTPMFAWLLYSVTFTSEFASRRLETLASMGEKLADLGRSLKDVFLFWLIPDSWIGDPFYPALINQALFVIGILFVGSGVVVGMVYVQRKIGSEKSKAINVASLLLIIFIVTYLLMIFVVYLTIFPPITVNIRMLSPVFAAVIWLTGILGGYRLTQQPISRWLKIGLTVVLVLGVSWYISRSVRIVQTNYDQGLGYQSVAWRESETLEAVKNLSPDTLIVTNEELLLLYRLGRPSYPLAEIYWNEPIDRFYRYGDGNLADDPAQRIFHEEGAVLVLFHTIEDQLQEIYGDRTDERIKTLTEGLQEIYKGKDGAIYIYPR